MGRTCKERVQKNCSVLNYTSILLFSKKSINYLFTSQSSASQFPLADLFLPSSLPLIFERVALVYFPTLGNQVSIG